MLDERHEDGVKAAWGHEPPRLTQHATERNTHVHPELMREIIQKTRKSSPVPSGDNRRSVSPTVGCGMSKSNAAINRWRICAGSAKASR
eukprot:5177436-Pleurochrysis_carterae.AAC.1